MHEIFHDENKRAYTIEISKNGMGERGECHEKKKYCERDQPHHELLTEVCGELHQTPSEKRKNLWDCRTRLENGSKNLFL